MPIPLLDEMIEKELEEAFEVKNKEALRRYVKLLVESFSEKSDIKDLGNEMKGGFKSLEAKIEVVNNRVEVVNNRVSEVREDIKLLIEMMNKRFEEQRAYTDKRFEDLLHYSDKRFEDMNKRFEDMNKRFEDMNKSFDDMNKRFEDMNKRFNLITWMIGIGFTLITVMIAVFKFLF